MTRSVGQTKLHVLSRHNAANGEVLGILYEQVSHCVAMGRQWIQQSPTMSFGARLYLIFYLAFPSSCLSRVVAWPHMKNFHEVPKRPCRESLAGIQHSGDRYVSPVKIRRPNVHVDRGQLQAERPSRRSIMRSPMAKQFSAHEEVLCNEIW